MELEHRYDDLLVKYLLNESTAEENQFVLNWMNTSESNRVYLQSLLNTLKLVHIKEQTDKLNVDQEWQHFQKVRQANHSASLPIINEVQNEEDTLYVDSSRSKSRVYRLIIAGAMAASLIFAMVISGNLFNSNKNIKQITARNSKTTINNADTLMAGVVFERNTTDKVKKITLPDNSEVELFPQSAVTYNEPAGRSKRQVILEGKADFKVAKDKNKPFTVFSSAISTTALGTRFTVIATAKAKKIYVQLHEGKVVVKSRKPATTMKDMYMVHGQELIYDVATQTAIVRSMSLGAADKKSIPFRELVRDNPIVPKYGKKAWFMFNNQSFKEIFDVLANMYDVKISYSKKDINQMYFIGTFNKADSIGKILREIAAVNNLTVVKDNGEYKIIRKDVKE